MRILTTAAVVGVVLGAGSGWTAASARTARPVQEAALPLAGTWVLNDELSDDPRAGRAERPDDDARRRGGRPGFGGRPGGSGPGPGGFGGRGGRFGGRGGARPDPEQAARLREALGQIMAAARRLTIAGDAEEVRLTYEDGRVVRLIPDGREHAGLAGTRGRLTRTTRWRGEKLETEIELQARRSVNVRQTYEVRAGGDGSPQLIVTTRVEGGRRRGGDREIRRVYDAGES